jgi:hypothetical protein
MERPSPNWKTSGLAVSLVVLYDSETPAAVVLLKVFQPMLGSTYRQFKEIQS